MSTTVSAAIATTTTTAADAPRPLDPLTFPLHGQRLIEASAGTGKTWTIAQLYLRLVLGDGGEGAADGGAAPGPARALMPAEILVVTFTKAATQELRERIRARLAEAARVFGGHGAPKAGDPLGVLLARHAEPAARAALAWRLATAAQSMDEAAIDTIHAWAWRMLREHALGSGTLAAQKLEAELGAIELRVLHDHWRRRYYPLAADAAHAVAQCFATPEALHAALKPLLKADAPPLLLRGAPFDDWQAVLAGLPQAGALAQAADAAQDAARALWHAHADALEAYWHGMHPLLNGNTYRQKSFATSLAALRAWSAGADLPDNMADNRAKWGQDGIHLRNGQEKPPQTEGVAAALQAMTDWCNCAAPDGARLRAALLADAAHALREALSAEKERRAQLGFDDVLRLLDRALAASGGAHLAEAIRQRLPVALIDEFQDTDALQYGIFRRIYAGAAHPGALILIGDPKQAIYAFRGADIRTYLRARADTAGAHYVLGTNFRSTAALTEAVNAVFARAEAQAPSGAFRLATTDPASSGDGPEKQAARPGAEAAGAAGRPARRHNPVPFWPVEAHGRDEVLWIDGAPATALTLWRIDAREGDQAAPLVRAGDYRDRAAAAFASAVVRWLSDTGAGRNGLRLAGGAWQPLRPADIAVLVRSHAQAATIRAALQARGLPSVFLSARDSVFATREAADVLHWLRAAAAPGDDALLRTALATGTLGLAPAALQALEQDELAWEHEALRWRGYARRWQREGVLPMLHALLHEHGVPASALAQPGGERRLTNVLHLAEWLQRRAAELEGLHALLRAYAAQVAEPPPGEEDVLRLESDAALLKVVTIHASKGLEYPLVLLPFIASGSGGPRDGGQPVAVHDAALGGPAIELDGSFPDARAALAEESLAEDLRLAYVALTRARHALWLGVAPLSSKTTVELGKGALGQLLAPAGALGTFEQYEAALEDLQAASPHIAVQPAPAADATRWQPPPAAALGPARTPPARAHAPWWIASYTALVRDLQAPRVGDVPAPGAAETAIDPAIDSALDPAAAIATVDPPTDAREAYVLEARAADAPPASVAASPAATGAESVGAIPAAAQPWHAFPAGAEPGSFLHQLFEWCARQGFAPLAHDAAPLRQRVAERAATRGWGAWAEPIADWVLAWLCAPLPLGAGAPATLAQLDAYRAEMEFWLATGALDAARIDALVTRHTFGAAPRPALAPARLGGMVKGYADLLFEHEGRYWVADYKSNRLGADDAAYAPAALQAAVLAHRYDLQAVLYVLALHRLLAARLPGYDYGRHVGGAAFFFLRGIAAPGAGVFAVRPPPGLIHRLDALLDGGEGAPA